MKSFLMVGQSNMAGRGEFGEVEEIKNPRCFVLKNGLWEVMREPVNVDAPIFKEAMLGNITSGIGLAPKYASCFFFVRIGILFFYCILTALVP